MIDPSVYLIALLMGAFVAAFVIGSVGFADALILNAVWLHVMEPSRAIPLIVSCGLLMHIVPLVRLRNTLDFSRLPAFALFGLLGVPLGVWALDYASPGMFKIVLALFLIAYAAWMLAKPESYVGEWGGRSVDGIVGLVGGMMGGFAGLSGLFPTLWVGLRRWPKTRQRGVFQPFVLIMHGLGVVTFAANGMITQQTGQDLLWCLPAILVGSWLGVSLYAYLNEVLFRRFVLLLLLVSGVALLV